MGSNTFILATQDPEAESEDQQETPIFEKRDTFLHGPGRAGLAHFIFFADMTFGSFL